MSSTCDRGLARPGYELRNVPKHFSVRCQQRFFLTSVRPSPRLFVTGHQSALIFLAGMSKTHTSGNVKASGNKKKEKNNGDNQHALSLKAGKDYEF